jgi:phosphate transport system substrate-binding protein
MKLNLLSVPFFAAIILTGCNSGTPTTAAARNSVQVIAAGSSFVYPVMTRWIQAYGQDHQGLQINYQSIGSGGGIEQLKNKLVDFAARRLTR